MLWSKAAGAGGTAGGGWNLTNAVYDGVSFSVNAQHTTPEGLFFQPDGTAMFVIGFNPTRVQKYTLSTPWDFSTLSTDNTFSVATQESGPKAVFFKPDGLKMYITGGGSDRVWEYNSTGGAWNASFWAVSNNIYVGSQDLVPTGISFKPDGSKMYMCGWASNYVNEYNLSTPWDVSTANFFQRVLVSSNSPTAEGVFFKPDGTLMFVVSSGNDTVGEYALSTPWDVSSAAHVQGFSVASEDTDPRGVFFKPDGSKMYVIGNAFNTVYQYSTA